MLELLAFKTSGAMQLFASLDEAELFADIEATVRAEIAGHVQARREENLVEL